LKTRASLGADHVAIPAARVTLTANLAIVPLLKSLIRVARASVPWDATHPLQYQRMRFLKWPDLVVCMARFQPNAQDMAS
jgi:hypothetical protein